MKDDIVILGLDIDGVLHREGCDSRMELVHRPALEVVLRKLPQVRVVITSDWRFDHTFDELRALFAEDLRDRILGATANLFAPERRYEPGLRQRELEAWVRENMPGATWLAVDDYQSRYLPGCPNLYAVPLPEDGGKGLDRFHMRELEHRLRNLISCVRLANSMKPDYVLLVAVSPDGRQVALLRKDHGPEEVVNKITFPGGRRDAGDVSHRHAVAREAGEEANLVVDPDALVEIDFEDVARHTMRTFFGVADLSRARSLTSEHVFVADFDAALAAAAGSRAHYYGPRVADILRSAAPLVAKLREANPTPTRAPVIPCEYPNFQQSLDKNRPHELTDLGPHGRPTDLEPKRRHQLVYRYLDTGETVMVPNVSYNQTPAMRAGTLRFEADRREERVRRMRKITPTGWTPAMVENVAERMLPNARLLRVMADCVEKESMTPDQQSKLHEQNPLQPEGAPSLAWARKQEQIAIAQAPAPATRPRMRM